MDWEADFDIDGCTAYVTSRGYKRVTLQFPDHLLAKATQVASAIQRACKAKEHKAEVYVLADTSYNSEGVDEVAAAHANADCVIHFGRASLSPLSRLPAYFVFGRAPIDTVEVARRIHAAAVKAAQESVPPAAVLVLPDQPYAHAAKDLRSRLNALAHVQMGASIPVVIAQPPTRTLEPSSGQDNTTCGKAAAYPAERQGSVPLSPLSLQQQAGPAMTQPPHGGPTPADASLFSRGVEEGEPRGAPRGLPTVPANARATAAGLVWELPQGASLDNCIALWLGPDDVAARVQLQMTHAALCWVRYDPAASSWLEGTPPEIGQRLRRGAYLLEKARNAAIVGIVVGTLGVAGYLGAVERIRDLARKAGKKTYTILMGKPSPVKLANFLEVDVFVMVADAQGQILDSKEFYAPVITPFEAQLAFSGGDWDGSHYRLDFGPLPAQQTPGNANSEARFSLLDGGLHGGPQEEAQPGMAIITRGTDSISLHDAKRGELVEVRSAADYLVGRRTYRGLETPGQGAPPKPVEKAVAGRTGRAAGYADEPSA